MVKAERKWRARTGELAHRYTALQDSFKQQVREYLRYDPSEYNSHLTGEAVPEEPKPPYEYVLWWRCNRQHSHRLLPCRGSLLDQPYILMRFFGIIEEEEHSWQRLQQINRARQKQWEAENATK